MMGHGVTKVGGGVLDWEVRGGFSEELISELKPEGGGGIQLLKEWGCRGAVSDRAAGAKDGKGYRGPRGERR